MKQLPKLSKWRHYKGDVYVVVGHSLRESDSALLVLYVPATRLLAYEAGHVLPWSRPRAEWDDVVREGLLRYERIIT